MKREMVTEQSIIAKMIISLILGGFMGMILLVYNILVLKPKKVRSVLERQGIIGPSPSFLYGNIPEMRRIHLEHIQSIPKESHIIAHDWAGSVFPHIQRWRNQFGPIFMYSTGSIQILCITDPEMAKEVSLCTSLSLGKPRYLSKDRGPLLGQGIFSSNGPYWAYQRKIIAPEFYLDKVKGMVSLMVASTMEMLKLWESRIEDGRGKVEIKVDEELRMLSADIISKACFGSDYAQGEKIFSRLRDLLRAMSKGNIGVPGSRFLPSKTNREIWRLEKEINKTILEVVKARSETKGENDLLQRLLEAAKNSGDNINIDHDKFVVDNCKNIYFAGHDTTATSASWCLMLLAAYPEWQARARSEVLEICGNNLPDSEMLLKMKVLTMVIQEAMRLYPVVAYVSRETLQDIRIKGIHIPKGVNLQVPRIMLHQEQELWGNNTHEFKPERFLNGTFGACKIPQAYMPFGIGPRICAGQHFAIVELKVILSLILSRFSFSLSPAYEHCPEFRLTIEPGKGVLLYVERL